MSVAGLDIGTSGCKCTIFEQDGRITSYAYKDYPIIVQHNGYMELNPNVVWSAVKSVIRKATNQHNGSTIKAMCITSFGEAGVLIDKKGEVLYNSMLYADPRGEAQCQQLIEKLGRWEITSRSGHNPKPMYSAPKLMWLRDNELKLFSNAEKFLQYSGYILYKLSGEKYEDYSLSSRTLMFNVRDKKFDDLLLSAAKLDKELFPQPIQTGRPISEIGSLMAAEIGLPKGTILVLGGQDQIAAAVGGGAIYDSMAVNGMGSVDCITPIFNKPNINKDMEKYSYGCIPYVIDNHYVTYAFNFAGGSLMRWYRDNFGHASYTEMEQSASKEPTGLLVLPHIMGAATPYMDAESKGAIIGVTVDTDNSTMYRAMMEGVAMESKINIDCLDSAGVKINRLTACGGGSRSNMWLQIKADVFNMPIDVLEVEEAGTLGAAVMAGSACGLYKDIPDGVDKLVKLKKTIYPGESNREKYTEIYERYKRLYNIIREIDGRNDVSEDNV